MPKLNSDYKKPKDSKETTKPWSLYDEYEDPEKVIANEETAQNIDAKDSASLSRIDSWRELGSVYED
jgi:hypothetical protein